MTHPEELLAGYVDGTLSATGPGGRRDTSRRSATDAAERSHWPEEPATALRSLTEVPAPPGVALEGARGSDRGSARPPPAGPPRWYRFGGHRRGGRRRAVGVHARPAPHRQGDGSVPMPPHGKHAERGPEALASGAALRGGKRDRDPARELRRRLADRACRVVSRAQPVGRERGRGRAAPVRARVRARRRRPTRRSPASCSRLPTRAASSRPSSGRGSRARPPTWRCSREGPGAGQPADTVTVWVFATRRTARSSPSPPRSCSRDLSRSCTATARRTASRE